VSAGPLAQAAKGPIIARLPGHDHTTTAKAERGLGSGINASRRVTRAPPHPTAGCSPACRPCWRSQGTAEVNVSIPGVAFSLLTHSDLPGHCESEPGRELWWRSRFMLRAWHNTRPGWEKNQTRKSLQTVELYFHIGLLHLQHVKQRSGWW